MNERKQLTVADLIALLQRVVSENPDHASLPVWVDDGDGSEAWGVAVCRTLRRGYAEHSEPNLLILPIQYQNPRSWDPGEPRPWDVESNASAKILTST